MFQKATKTQSRLRLAISGASGSGKTFSSLAIAQHLGQSVALIDTERGSASKYAHLFNFDVCELTSFHPSKYIEAIRAADRSGYDVLIIDSLTHAWFAELELAGGEFRNWAKVKPLERALTNTILASRSHIIATMRSKTEWIMEPVKNKKGIETLQPKKVGTSPLQSSGIEYEFDVAGELNLEHLLTISKSRCPALADTTHLNPGQDLAEALLTWLSDGEPMPESAASKCDRVKLAREAAGLDIESLRTLMKTHYQKANPAYLSTEQCDQLIAMMQSLQTTPPEQSTPTTQETAA
jgi:hypothetical protein